MTHRPAFTPGDQPWADYYRTLFPGWATPRDGFNAWKYASTAVAVSKQVWSIRQLARRRHGRGDGEHRTAILVHPYDAHYVACLECTWLVAVDDAYEGARLSRDHATVDELPPVVDAPWR